MQYTLQHTRVSIKMNSKYFYVVITIVLELELIWIIGLIIAFYNYKQSIEVPGPSCYWSWEYGEEVCRI